MVPYRVLFVKVIVWSSMLTFRIFIPLGDIALPPSIRRSFIVSSWGMILRRQGLARPLCCCLPHERV